MNLYETKEQKQLKKMLMKKYGISASELYRQALVRYELAEQDN